MSVTPKIGHFLGMTVLVSIPALFSDGVCRAYTLVGFEVHGLWLQSQELNERLLSEEMREIAEASPVVFVPFAQIASVLVPTDLPATPPQEAAPATGATRKRRPRPAPSGS
jgi:hypothetical protein